MKPIKIIDIEVKNPALINFSEIARQSNLSVSYVTQLLDKDNIRKNERALRKIRNTIIKNISIPEPQHA